MRLPPFTLHYSPFLILPLLALSACDSHSLNQSDANPLVIFAAQLAEGSVPDSPTTPTTTPAAQDPPSTPPQKPLALAPTHPSSQISNFKSPILPPTPW